MTDARPRIDRDEKRSWVPMIAIALAQAMMSYNVASLPVAMGGMVESFGVPPTTVATGIVMYSSIVAGFVMLGAKLNQRFGSVLIFRTMVILFGLAQLVMTLSPSASFMIFAQALSGAAAAVLVPALVALIAENYRGVQQATALGTLGSARAGAGVSAFLIGGFLGTNFGWRPAFALMVILAVVIFLLSFRLRKDKGDPDIRIDGVGVVLAAASILSITFGLNNLNGWGTVMATPNAPFAVLGLSPAPFLILVGVVLGQTFFHWTRRRERAGQTPLLALAVIDSPLERAAVYAMFAVVALEAMLNFTIPLYIQIVQGRSAWATTVAMLPFNLTVFFAAILVVRFYKRLTPRTIGRLGFCFCTAALLWLAFVVRNDWSSGPVLIGLVAFGIGQGALVTLLFNVLVTASPASLAGDVGALRGTTNNLASAVGTAVAGALLVALLSATVMTRLAGSPILTEEVASELDLGNINFVSNDHLETVLADTTASPEQRAKALLINTEGRLWALKVGLLLMAGIAFLGIVPAGRLPDYLEGEVPDPSPDS
ncbi:putative MFS family arabinose efflux permease [Novosphingobium sp. PhB165]|uniref:MFS transporter n=1 Tax=Novosphingobium sp. PhB165 TaxID=2485105 RepID=UPI0010E2B581|nr:MFS transporter [Novosphingobium sp. PhB165]TCM20618.1 putative MFS family arabinose efflux permease [Novosphingobium sp. PhB165]